MHVITLEAINLREQKGFLGSLITFLKVLLGLRIKASERRFRIIQGFKFCSEFGKKNAKEQSGPETVLEIQAGKKALRGEPQEHCRHEIRPEGKKEDERQDGNQTVQVFVMGM